jgi:PHS family inorganic phosphate transporter-like MFS transporter
VIEPTTDSRVQVIGQIGFGLLADVVGRKKMYGLELILIIFATLAQALTSASPAITITGVIIVRDSSLLS